LLIQNVFAALEILETLRQTLPLVDFAAKFQESRQKHFECTLVNDQTVKYDLKQTGIPVRATQSYVPPTDLGKPNRIYFVIACWSKLRTYR